METGKAEAHPAALTAVPLVGRGETKSLGADLVSGSRRLSKFKALGVSAQLAFSSLVQNPWSSQYNTQRLVCVDSAEQRWFGIRFVEAARELGVAMSLLPVRTTYTSVSLPSSYTIRKLFAPALGKRLCEEKAKSVAFPALLQQAQDQLDKGQSEPVITDLHTTCPLLQLGDEAKQEYAEKLGEIFETKQGQIPREGLRDAIIVYMEAIDRLKIIQFVLQNNTDHTTSYNRLPALVLQLLSCLHTDDARLLCPRLTHLEVDFKHSIGGLCVGLPGFPSCALMGLQDAYRSRGIALGDTKDGKGSSGSNSAPSGSMSPLSLPAFIRTEYPVLDVRSLLAATFAYWSDYLRVHSVALEHMDGILYSVADACIAKLAALTTHDPFTHLADSVGVSPHIRAMATPAWMVESDQHKALRAVLIKNHGVMQKIDTDAYRFVYTLMGQIMPDDYFKSAARRGECLARAEQMDQEDRDRIASCLMSSRRQWTSCSFKRISTRKVETLLLRHGHKCKLEQFHDFCQRVGQWESDPLVAVLLDGMHGNDVFAGLERVLMPDQYFIACFTNEPDKRTHTYTGIYQTVVAAKTSDMTLYQRYAALRFHDPTNGMMDAKREEGIQTQRLPFAPAILQLLESPHEIHRLAGVSLLREWMGYSRLFPADWNDHTKMAAKVALRCIDCAAASSYVGEDVLLLLKIMQLALAFDSTLGAAYDPSSTGENFIYWRPGAPLSDKEERISHTKVADMLYQFVLAQERKQDTPLMPFMIDQLRTMRVRGPAMERIKDFPVDYKDTAYTRAGLILQLSTAYHIEDPIAPSACTASHERAAKLRLCLALQEMQHFGYSDEEINQFPLNMEAVQEDVHGFTTFKHLCPACFEFPLGVHTSASGVSVPSATSRFYIWKTDHLQQVDVSPAFWLFYREFSGRVTPAMSASYNALAERYNTAPPPVAAAAAAAPVSPLKRARQQQPMQDENENSPSKRARDITTEM